MVDWEADSWSLRHVNKNDNMEKKSLKSIIKRYPFIYYAIVGVIIFLVLKFIQPAIMMRIARQAVYDMKGTNYLLVQTDETILRYILPFGFALSMSISVTIAFLLILIVTKCFCRINAYAPLLEVVTMFVSVAIAVSAVYTLGYESSKEIYQKRPEQFREFIDEANGMGKEYNGEDAKQRISVEIELEESETHTSVPNDNFRNYAYDGSENKQDSVILGMGDFNETINFIFAAAATLIIPLNYYKDKKNEA